MEGTMKIGVSPCLLGERVRYDGGQKSDGYIADTLGRYFSFVPVCPEVECGMPVPREPMRLEGDPAYPRLIARGSRIDMTHRMRQFCDRRVAELASESLCGFILKKRSPSCGLHGVKVYREGMAARSGSGLFAAALASRFPLLPLEDESRLGDPCIRENFIARLFGRHRWLQFMADGPTHGKLVAFHTTHKLLMMAHSPLAYREIGALVAHGGELPPARLFNRYEELYMKALGLHATKKKNTNVLQHIMGYFKGRLTAMEKGELLQVIGLYHDHLVPLIVPVTLLRHYASRYDHPYLKQQIYLYPHPAELMLRNHA